VGTLLCVLSGSNGLVPAIYLFFFVLLTDPSQGRIVEEKGMNFVDVSILVILAKGLKKNAGPGPFFRGWSGY
jgi:hypothetical protein